MVRTLAFVFLLAFAPFSACTTASSPTTSTGVVDTANKQLVVAEYAYQAALKFIQVETRAGRIKGEKAATIQRYLRLATNALDVARDAVVNGRLNAVALLATAVGSVSDLTKLFSK